MHQISLETARETERMNQFAVYNHIEMVEVEPDHAIFRLNIRPESKNGYGMVHGGAIYAMADNATGFAAELNDGNSKIEEMKAEFNRIVSWSKIFDESPMEVKEMICGYIIKKVSVFRDYRIKIEFNINVEQFLNGIDSIDECDTYELPMAQ